MTEDSGDVIARLADKHRATLDRLAEIDGPVSLADRIRAAITQRRALAEALDGETWTVTPDDTEACIATSGGRFGCYDTDDDTPIGLLDLAEARLIADGDPAQTIRRCAADLALLDAHLGYYLDEDDDEHLPIPTLSILAHAYGLTALANGSEVETS